MLEFPFSLSKTLKNSNQAVDQYATQPDAQQFRCCMLCGCSLYMFVRSNTAKVFQRGDRMGSKEVNLPYGNPSLCISLPNFRVKVAYGFCPLHYELLFLSFSFFFFHYQVVFCCCLRFCFSLSSVFFMAQVFKKGQGKRNVQI